MLYKLFCTYECNYVLCIDIVLHIFKFKSFAYIRTVDIHLSM